MARCSSRAVQPRLQPHPLLAGQIVTFQTLLIGARSYTETAVKITGHALVEDGVPGPGALQLEEPVGPGHQEHTVPQARGVLAARDR
jgi:hypothetical protein